MAKKAEDPNAIPKQLTSEDFMKQLSRELSYDASGKETAKAFLSTGSIILDMAIANRKDGGIAQGRLTECSGDESCVTEDTIVDILVDGEEHPRRCAIVTIKQLLAEGRQVYVRSVDEFCCDLNRYVKVECYVEKGILPAYEVRTANNRVIRASATHRFLTLSGWQETNLLCHHLTKLFCDDGTYSEVQSVESVGDHNIVDIKIDDDCHCYFGNGILNHNSGKSAIAAGVMASGIKKGLRVLLLDNEGTSTPDYLAHFGVDASKIVRLQLKTIEDNFKAIEFVCKRRIEDGGPDWLIVWDSIASTPAKEELEDEIDANKIGIMARAISKGMRRIGEMVTHTNTTLFFTNQTRTDVMKMFGDKTTTPGGKAVKFYASTRIRLFKKEELKDAAKRCIGIAVRAKVIKNKVAPPLREAFFRIYFTKGIDDTDAWFDILKNAGTIVQAGSWYDFYVPGVAEPKRIRREDFEAMINSDAMRKSLQALVEKALIVDETVNIPSVVEAEEAEGDCA